MILDKTKNYYILIHKNKEMAEQVQLFLYKNGFVWANGEHTRPLRYSELISYINYSSRYMTYSSNPLSELRDKNPSAIIIEGSSLVCLKENEDGNYW